MLGYIFLGLLFFLIAILIGLLFIPVILRIDTVDDEYHVRLKGLAMARLITIEDWPAVQLKFPFFKKDIRLFSDTRKKKRPKAASTEITKSEKKRKSRPALTPRKIRALLHSFRIEQFYVSLDTGDYVKNALLVPVLQRLNHYRNQVGVNFNGETIILFQVSNNLWRLGTAYLGFRR
jgi:hypothetical protein